MKDKEKILNYKAVRQGFLISLDIILLQLAAILSLGLGFEFAIPRQYYELFLVQNNVIYIFIMIGTYFLFSCYGSLWRYASVDELLSVVLASILGNLILMVVFFLIKFNLPPSFYVANMFTTTAFIGGLRFFYRFARKLRRSISKTACDNVLIIGADRQSEMIIKEFLLYPSLNKLPVAIVDNDKMKIGRKIHGIRVVGSYEQIPKIVAKKNITELIITRAKVSQKEKNEIIEVSRNLKIKLKTMPRLTDVFNGNIDINAIRDIDIEDLLGRAPIKTDMEGISCYLKDEVVLVTGGGGSIGSELCRQVLTFAPKKLIILDIYENNAYDLQQSLIMEHGSKINVEVVIASVRDKKRIEQVFDTYKPSVVFHAAAHKHVPLMEANPSEAVKNNVFGTLNVAEAADKFKTKKFILISTDKAVNPTNIMGATKRIAEIIIQTMNRQSETEFVAVRFGNVLGSNGSVIPLFKKQIQMNKKVTVTHPDIIRYFMTIPEAVQLVLQAANLAQGGEIFVLDMGEPVKIDTLARDVIKLSGFIPDVDVKIEYVGLRPGEKLYEELLMAEEGLSSTKHEKIFIAKPIEVDIFALRRELQNLEYVIKEKIHEQKQEQQSEIIEEIMRKLVPTYKKVAGL